jgi:phytoene dehydrogenase-like protein
MVQLHRDGTYDGDFDLDLPNNRVARARLTREEQAGLRRYLDFEARLYRILAPYLLAVPPTLEELRRRAVGTPDEEVLRLAATTPLWELQDQFLPAGALRDHFAVEASAVACNPNAFALARGVVDEPLHGTNEPPLNGYVRGGMGNMAAALWKSAERAGASARLATPVERILVEKDRAVGLRLADGTEIQAKAILSCVDPKTTFLRLLPPEAVESDLRRRVEKLVTHVSCYKFLAAISELPKWTGWDGEPDYPACGGVQLGISREGVRRAYDDLAQGRPPRRPIISFGVPSMRDPTLAPPGYHTASLFIYPAPARLRTGSWDDVRTEVAEALIDQITECAPNFRRSIVSYKLRTPLDIEREQAMPDGCIWHIQHTPEQLFGSRPLPELAGYRAPIASLYLGGAGQHPGGEVSGIPGHNAARQILKDLGP